MRLEFTGVNWRKKAFITGYIYFKEHYMIIHLWCIHLVFSFHSNQSILLIWHRPPWLFEWLQLLSHGQFMFKWCPAWISSVLVKQVTITNTVFTCCICSLPLVEFMRESILTHLASIGGKKWAESWRPSLATHVKVVRVALQTYLMTFTASETNLRISSVIQKACKLCTRTLMANKSYILPFMSILTL